TPDMFGRWNALVTDSGFAVFIGNNTTHVPIQKYTSGTNRYIVGDTSASNPGAIVTQSSRQKLSDSLQLLIAAHTTDSGFQVLRTPLTNTPLAKFVDGSGDRFVEWDTIPTNPGAIVTSASRQKLLDSLNLVFRAAFVANLLKVQYLGYDFYANHPTGAGTMGVFIARDSIPTGAMFWDSAGIMTNLTPYVTLSVRGKGQPGDTTMITLSGSILTGFNINVAAMRDSVGSCVHHIFNADGSITFYSTCVLNNGASTGIKAGTFATRPTSSNCQCYYWSTDSLFWSYDNGSWKDLKAGGITVTNTAGTGPATTASGNVLNVDTMRWAHIYSVKDFGAVGDGKRITDGAITSASHTFTSAMAGF